MHLWYVEINSYLLEINGKKSDNLKLLSQDSKAKLIVLMPWGVYLRTISTTSNKKKQFISVIVSIPLNDYSPEYE